MTEQAKISADAAAIRRDLEYMTARWGELAEPARFEVRALKEHCQPQSFRYAPDAIDFAVADILNMNAMGYNIYAVRNPIRATATGSASDGDILASFFLWADCDDDRAATNVHRFNGPKWSAAVTTGKTPSIRVHTYWQLAQACDDMAAWRDMQVRIAAHFGSDSTVVNPSRIMRVAGTVTHPNAKKQAKGYVPELAFINTEYAPARPPVTMDQMARVFGAAPAAQPSFQIDTGERAPSLDRERLAIQAMSGQDWHNAVIRLVASYVGKGLTDGEIHGLTQPLTLAGYTSDQTAQEVQTAIDGARRKGWTPQEQPTPQIAATASTARPVEVEWFDDAAPILSGAYLVKGVIDAGAMSVVYGPSNSGKTFFAFDMAFHIAAGIKWRDKRVTPSAVLYLAAEGGRGAMNRMAALRATHGIDGIPFALKRAGLDLLNDNADIQHIADLARAVAATQPSAPLLIVIDTLSRIMAGGDENSAADMTRLIRNIDAVREATGAHIMLVHHTGKDTARGARGHSSLRAATDTEIEVGNDNGARAAMVTKQRDHQGGDTFAFSLKTVVLGADQDGDEVTSCVVEVVNADDHQAAAALQKPIGGNQKILLETFDQMVAEGLAVPNAGGVGMPDAGRFWAVKMEDFRRHAQGKMAASNGRGAFLEAWRALSEGRGVLCAASEMVWRTDRPCKGGNR